MKAIQRPGDTIAAISTPAGTGAIALVRLSGPAAFEIGDSIFKAGKKLKDASSHSVLFGIIENEGKITDEVVVTIFRNPHSFTGEDTIEISCHGSAFIQKEILNLVIDKGARLAEPGEYTMRAFLNRKIDL